jgi:hypothetical protein
MMFATSWVKAARETVGPPVLEGTQANLLVISPRPRSAKSRVLEPTRVVAQRGRLETRHALDRKLAKKLHLRPFTTRLALLFKLAKELHLRPFTTSLASDGKLAKMLHLRPLTTSLALTLKLVFNPAML